MQIEIDDELAEKFKACLGNWPVPEDMGDAIADYMKRELYKLGAAGHERDCLTGCLNRGALSSLIYGNIRGQPKEDLKIYSEAFLCVNLANLRGYSECHGLPAGDEVIIKVATQLLEHYGKQSVYRYGGGDFIIPLSNRKPFVPENEAIKLKTSIVRISVSQAWPYYFKKAEWVLHYINEAFLRSRIGGAEFSYSKILEDE